MRTFRYPASALAADALRVGAGVAVAAVVAWSAGPGGVLGWIGLAISCIGLHGLVSYTIVQRRRQIGIQMALGATAGRVVRTVLRGALRQILVGLAVGLPVSWLLAALIAHYTSIVGATDARSLLLTPMVLLLVALLAAWWPARRSADIEPAEVLRSEA